VTISAESGYESDTKLDFTLSVIGFSHDFDLGTVSPPYPKSCLYNVSIPDYLPFSVTAVGILKAKSGTVLRQEQIEIYIDVPFNFVGLPGKLLDTFIELSNMLLDMSAT